MAAPEKSALAEMLAAVAMVPGPASMGVPSGVTAAESASLPASCSPASGYCTREGCPCSIW